MTVPRVLTDAETVAVDLGQPVPEPVLIAHVVTLAADALVAAGLVPAWLALPDAVAAIVSLGGALVMVVAHAAAWVVARGRVHAFRSGRHAAR